MNLIEVSTSFFPRKINDPEALGQLAWNDPHEDITEGGRDQQPVMKGHSTFSEHMSDFMKLLDERHAA